MGTIRRNLALKELEVKENPSGKQRTFSIRFIKVNGESVFLPLAVATGLRFNMSAHRMRAAVGVNKQGNTIGHIYPIRIDNIIEFNNLKVVM